MRGDYRRNGWSVKSVHHIRMHPSWKKNTIEEQKQCKHWVEIVALVGIVEFELEHSMVHIFDWNVSSISGIPLTKRICPWTIVRDHDERAQSDYYFIRWKMNYVVM